MITALATRARTAAAEDGVSLLLHLRNALGLEVYQIALFYMPGGIVLTVMPRVLQGPLGRVSQFVLAGFGMLDSCRVLPS